MSPTLLDQRRHDVTVSEHLFNLQSNYLKARKETENYVQVYSRWNMPAAAALLESEGITVNDRPTESHGHGASKTIEEYINVVVIRLLFTENFTVFGNLTPDTILTLSISIPYSETAPPELLDDQPPLFPSLYTFKQLNAQDFEFYPDGNVNG
ncbi:10778_t:CDS:2, partial [Racocetra persica]